jgi:antitoxin HicB
MSERSGIAVLELVAGVHWEEPRRAFEVRVLLIPEEGGGYSAHALRLPGVVSEGETIKEALTNIEDAFRASIETYEEAGGPIPWGDADVERTPKSIERWILVNV